MSKHPSTLELFRSFCFQNGATDFEQAVEYFAVFGGMGWRVDFSKSLDELIEEKVLKNYRYIHADIAKITQSDKIHHGVLTGIATGDGREHTAFKRANISRQEGEASIDFLVENNLLIRESSQAQPVNEKEVVSDKYSFSLPFLRFWFSSISPYYKGIREGDYSEMKKQFENRKSHFSELVYVQLLRALIIKNFTEDPIEKIGAYWDKDTEIEVLAKTKAGKIVAGSCKFTKAKAKKSELNRLKELCSKAELTPEILVLFSKSGFSNELKKEKGATLKLYSVKNMKILMDDLTQEDLIISTNKKY